MELKGDSMPKRGDIKSILVIGSGPIVIGQACEFDYSGTQAIRALKAEGYRVVLVNSNPATIMTDPDLADRTYIEPITADYIEEIIRKERPDAVLPTMGGQTALNAALELDERGVFTRYGCEMIGANIDAIKTAEDRELFRQAMEEIGLESAKSEIARSLAEAREHAKRIGLPIILRPSRTLGGMGGGIVEEWSQLDEKVEFALSCSPNREVLIEESLLGWKEIELEVMRDRKDNVVIVCGIENLDPMGVHTGDSITVAPIQTLTDKEYQLLRDHAIKIIRRIGVETGGSNVQFAINPGTGRIIVIEMNPRVSRSSALASKATGFPIAKIAARLAVGYTLDEIVNDITKETPACFEPAIDYVVVKIPRFNFEKFPLSETVLGTQMKSVGEVLAFGRNFPEALQKAMNGIELDSCGFDAGVACDSLSSQELEVAVRIPGPRRLWNLGEALRRGMTVPYLAALSGIDHWFLSYIAEIIDAEEKLKGRSLASLTRQELFELKRCGFSDGRLGSLLGVKGSEVERVREAFGILPSFKAVDTCAAEFKAFTPYLYSSFDAAPSGPAAATSLNESAAVFSGVATSQPQSMTTASKGVRGRVIILGSGPSRIGQGIEFDYCCVHAVFALRAQGYEAIMINCNPETVSTDYDISDRLYFEPLTIESVAAIVARENPLGVILQFGGQTPLKLSSALAERGIAILGTSVASIDAAEDREQFAALVNNLKLQQPRGAMANSLETALVAARSIGFPLMMRPSFVLGGRAMRVVYSEDEVAAFIRESVEVSHERPVLLDRFLENAVEVDVDAIGDGEDFLVAGVMEHIERAGIHSGDSSCSLPPYSLADEIVAELKRQAVQLAAALKVKGLLNVQFAVDVAKARNPEDGIYILEANPRASRTIPFVSKATGVPWAQIATRCMLGESLREMGVREVVNLPFMSVKESVFPFKKFRGVDPILGPEMKSTGEVMGIDKSFAGAFWRAERAAGTNLPASGMVFISARDGDKSDCIELAQRLRRVGFSLIGTKGTAEYLRSRGIEIAVVNKVREGSPHIVDLIERGDVAIVVNTPEGSGPALDSRSIRLAASERSIPLFTTLAAALAGAKALEDSSTRQELEVTPLQDYHLALD